MNSLFAKNRRQVYREWAEALKSLDFKLARSIIDANLDLFSLKSEHRDEAELNAALRRVK